MFYLIHPNTMDHGSCASILADLTELLATAISHPDFGTGRGQRDGGAHLAMMISSGLNDLEALAKSDRERASEEGYRRGLADAGAPRVTAPELTEPAPQSGKRQRTA